MRRLARTIALAVLVTPAALAAQAGEPVTDPLYQRAQELVMHGNGADGRALVDSVLRVARSGSPEYAEALYWRAALAETAAEAERGYLRLTIEYPLHPRTEQALVRLAQLEQTRGNRMLAVSRLQRAVLDFPESPDRARTQLRMARLYLDEQRLPEGCGALQEARRMADEGDVELRNQLEYLSHGCAGVAVAAPGAGSRVAESRTAELPESTHVAAAPRRVATPTPAERASVAKPAKPTPAKPTPAKPTPARPTPAAPVTSAATKPAAPAAGNFSVQVAAFDRAAPAESLVKELRADGLEARVDADDQWHRVRIGHFATREEAAALAKRLKERGITGFVTGVGR